MFTPEEIRADFPILRQSIHGHPLVYLDNAATSQKPQQVIDAITSYYTTSNANVHRGVHALSDASTLAWEQSRATIASFLGADSSELIVVRNTTEASNGIIQGWAQHNIAAGEVILLTELEHHSNFVVWQEFAKKVGAQLVMIPINQVGQIQLDSLKEIIQTYTTKIKVCSFAWVSNTLGVEQPLDQIVEVFTTAYSANTRPKISIDAAQAAPHKKISFQALGVDMLTFSGHKMLGPMGFGGLLVSKQLLESGEFQPWLFGGGMIDSVSTTETLFHPDISERFTAGTPDVASAVGMAAACEYLSKLGMENVEAHDRQLTQYAVDQLSQVPELELIGPTGSLQNQRLGSVAFLYKGVHAHDVAQILDSQGIAVRSGHHCTMPLHLKMNWQATVRASFQVYTTMSDIDMLVAGLDKVRQIFLPKGL